MRVRRSGTGRWFGYSSKPRSRRLPYLLLPLSIVAQLFAPLVSTASGAAASCSDFQITLSPASQTLQPGSFVKFAVGIGPINGFAEPVTLSVSSDGLGGALPIGVAGDFSPNPVSPPGTSFLTLTATQDAAIGSFPVIVTGTGGGNTCTATGQANVDFGLVPTCFGAAEGTVTDAETGQPIANASVLGVLTDESGHYRIDGLPLGTNNSPQEFFLHVTKDPDYWSADKSGVAVGVLHEDGTCEPQTTTIDFTLVPVHTARISGRVVEGNVVPPDYDHVIPTTTPIEGAFVLFDDLAETTSGLDGAFDMTFPVGHDNTPVDASLGASKSIGERHGYWGNSSGLLHVEAGDDLVQDIALVKQCTGSVSGQAVYPDTGLPAQNVRVDVFLGGLDADFATTDDQGRFSIPELLLGYNNAPVDYVAQAGNGPFEFPHFENCGDHVDITLDVNRPRYGAIEGYVFDQETRQPIEGVGVSLPGGQCPCALTDANGHYRLDHILLDDIDDQPRDVGIVAGQDDYWPSLGLTVQVAPNDTALAPDIFLLRRHYAIVTGIVSDAITHAPILDAAVTVFDPFGHGGLTDSDGRYAIDRVQLADRNTPHDVTVQASALGYWDKQSAVGVEADKTSTLDLELLPICQDATISGTVVNASTGVPIQNASVSGASLSTTTDVNGNYRLEHLRVGDNNSPIEVQVTAQAEGFYTQTKAVTVFCGASISLDFGREGPKSAIEGYVTDVTGGTPGTPMAGVFVGSEFGGSDVTDANGHYILTDAPLNPDGSPRSWDITAEPAGFDAQTKAVTVHANETARLDFTFTAAPPDTGSLSVTKTLDAGGATTDLPTSYSVHYDCGTGHTGDVTVVAGGTTLADGSVPFGTNCTLSEPNLPGAPIGYSFGAPTFSPSATVTIDANTPSVTVTTTNTLTRDTGTLELAKHLSSGPAGYTGPFTIHWDCGAFGSGNVTVSPGNSATVNDIPTGTQCTVSETPPLPPTGYSFGTPTFSPSATVTIATKGATVTVTTNNTLTRDTGSLHITKVVVGGGATFMGSFDVLIACTGDGGAYNRTIAYPTPGDVTISGIPTGNTCAVTETSRSSAPTGYSWGTVTITGGPTAAISTITTRDVTVTNVVTGRAKVIKTKGGLPLAGTDSFTFQLRQGADTNNVGTILESQNASAANGGVISFATVLVPGQHYQTCELVMPGWNTNLQGTLFVPGSIIPPALPNPNVDNSPVCVDFVAQAGTTTTFNVDNSFPGGLARTIGFWKNWASCTKSNGGQKPVLDQTLAISEPSGIVVSAQSGTYPGFTPTFYLTLHGSTTTPNVAPDCSKAVNLLNKSTMITGKKMASDPAFNLAAQLIAAELNFTAGAAKNGAVITAVNQSVVLLGKYKFIGGGYSGKISATDAATMNKLATTLDHYNNNQP